MEQLVKDLEECIHEIRNKLQSFYFILEEIRRLAKAQSGAEPGV